MKVEQLNYNKFMASYLSIAKPVGHVTLDQSRITSSSHILNSKVWTPVMSNETILPAISFEIHSMPIMRKKHVRNTSSNSKWSLAGQGGVPLAVQEQIKLLGCKALYDRLDKGLSLIENDLFLLPRQQQLYEWREKVLKESILWKYEEQIAFLATLSFNRVLEKLDSTEDSKHTVDRVRIHMELGKDAFIMFKLPLVAVPLLRKLHWAQIPWVDEEGGCDCSDCLKTTESLRRLLPRHYDHDTVTKAAARLSQSRGDIVAFLGFYSPYNDEPRRLQ